MNRIFRNLVWVPLLIIIAPGLCCWFSVIAGDALIGPAPDGSNIAHWIGLALKLGGIVAAVFLFGGLVASNDWS